MKRSTKTGISAGTTGFLLGLLAFLGGLQHGKKESCEIKVDKAHISQYSLKKYGTHNLKIDVTTKCTKPQKYSSLSVSVYKVERSLTTKVHEFPSKNYEADVKHPERAYALDRELLCVGFHPLKYYGVADGTVFMRSGKKIPVHGKSTLIPYVDCVI